MSRDWTFDPGNWNIICDVCGQKYKASEIKKRWDGLFVCAQDYEERHIQDFIRVTPDKITVPFIRNPCDSFGASLTCDIWAKHPYAGYGKIGCMELGFAFYSEQEMLFEFPLV